MVPFCSIDLLGGGPTALGALSEPVALATGWAAAGPPWPVVLLAILAILLLWVPGRRRAPTA